MYNDALWGISSKTIEFSVFLRKVFKTEIVNWKKCFCSLNQRIIKIKQSFFLKMLSLKLSLKSVFLRKFSFFLLYLKID